MKVGPSLIQGVVVFALRDIKEGEKLYLDHVPTMYNLRIAVFGKLEDVVKQFLLERWPQIVNGSMFAYPDCRYSAFLNHADEPNVSAVNDVALQDIKAGEEITEDYRLINSFEVVFPWLDKKKEV